jgi:FkbM family methyltransferase
MAEGPDHASPSDAKLAGLEKKIADLTQQILHLRNLIENSPGARSIHLGEHLVLTRTTFGPKIYLDGRDIGIANHIMFSGQWESANTREVKRIVRRGQVAIDVGANFGYYSLLLCHLVGEQGRVISFEPNPNVYPLLVRSLKLNGYLKREIAQPFSCALSDGNGKATLSFRLDNYGGGTLYAPNRAQRPSDLVQAEVETRTLDSLDIPSGRPLFIKIDAEGAEYPILKGADKLLRSVDDVVMMLEFTPQFIRKHLPVDDFVRFLSGLEFLFFEVTKENLAPITPEALARKPGGYIFASRRNIAT